jgi:dienelactone hydrolase
VLRRVTRQLVLRSVPLEPVAKRSEVAMAVPSLVKAILSVVSALFTSALLARLPADDAKEAPGHPQSERSPFLDALFAPKPVVIAKPVQWVSAFGEQQGLLVRETVNERLPALLLIASARSNNFFLQSAHELASIGFTVLLVEIDGNQNEVPPGLAPPQQNDAIRLERGLAQLSSAVRWLRRRDDVFPDKIGVLGWGKTTHLALELAAAQNLQAAVLTDVELPLVPDPPLSIGLRQTAVFIVAGAYQVTPLDREFSARLERAFEIAHVEHRVLELKSAKTGFMDSQRREAFDAKSADRAWFEIYEFLGKHVEDAELKTPLITVRSSDVAPAAHPFVSIGDVMRAVNGASGVCGDVAQSLNEDPREEKDWKLLRARAAIMADSGALLMGLQPLKGSPSSWQRHAASYRGAATVLAAAADRRNIAEVRQAFARLKANCSRCHSDHR